MKIWAATRGLDRAGSLVLSLACLLSTASGCSWLFTQPLPEQYPRYDIPPCSTSRAPPVLDTIFTATNVASAIYVAGKPNVANKEQAVPLGLSVALLWGLSASYGYRHTAECEEAHRLRPARWSPSPRSYHPPPPRPAPPPETAAPPPGQPVPAPEAPGGPPAIQQQDDDDPGLRRPSRPRPNAPVERHPAPWAPHGPEAPWAPHGPE